MARVLQQSCAIDCGACIILSPTPHQLLARPTFFPGSVDVLPTQEE